ncbi:hypothetical protein N9W34_02280 [Rickettsiales bacterium]|nr:hypothetical protein [Rickettsiales bacterium]
MVSNAPLSDIIDTSEVDQNISFIISSFAENQIIDAARIPFIAEDWERQMALRGASNNNKNGIQL